MTTNKIEEFAVIVREGYTMTLESYDMKIGEVVEIFTSLVGYMKKGM